MLVRCDRCGGYLAAELEERDDQGHQVLPGHDCWIDGQRRWLE